MVASSKLKDVQKFNHMNCRFFFRDNSSCDATSIVSIIYFWQYLVSITSNLGIKTLCVFFITCSVQLSLQADELIDKKQPSWSTKVNVFNPSCTNGEVACWADIRNSAANLELHDYIPLKIQDVDDKHHICVSFPHMKDSYWAGVAYGIISEGKRLGQKITLFEAGGYTHLEKQLTQVDDCIANGGEALIIGPISNHGNARQIELIREKGIPVLVIITGMNTTVDANSLQSFNSMAYTSCQWITRQHAPEDGNIKIVWFPGPPAAGWSMAANEGCRRALQGSHVEIIETKWGDTGKAIQLKLVEETLQAMASGSTPEFHYIVGTATTIEGAVGALRERKLENKIKLVAYYYTPGMHVFLKRGLVSMTLSDQMIIQAKIAVDQSVRLLENKPMATKGRPEFNNSQRITEHVQPQKILVTPENIVDFDTTTTLAPKGWIPIFSVD